MQTQNYSKSADNQFGMDRQSKQYASCLAYPIRRPPQRPSKQRTCINLKNTLLQKWSGHVHPVATPLMALTNTAHSIRRNVFVEDVPSLRDMESLISSLLFVQFIVRDFLPELHVEE